MIPIRNRFWSQTSPIADFPNELLLEMFSFLPLKSLIAARGVNREWRSLVQLSDIPPERRALLELYYDIIQTPYFLASRKAVIRSLSPFDRAAYITALEQCLGYSSPAGMMIK